MKRRKFLKTSSTFSLPFLLNGFQLGAMRKSSIFDFVGPDNDKILVIINLNGGNDGLNTVIPLDSYSQLSNLRGNIMIPENKLLGIDGNNGFHPALEGMHQMYQEGYLKLIQGVGYPNQNRSHFRSVDIWNTGAEAETYLKDGWLGRYYEDEHPNYPTNYPNPDYPHPLAITMGSFVSETCQGTHGNFSMTINDVNSLGVLPESVQGPLPDNCYGSQLGFVIDTIKQTNIHFESVKTAYDSGNNLSAKYPDTQLAQHLKTVAKLISGGLQTKAYVLTLGGFDTHANQTVSNDATEGVHATLLENLSNSICAFQDDLTLLGHEQRVLGMTSSEFGRRIRSNFSYGTDHGSAAPMFVFGACAIGGTVGDNPIIEGDEDGQAGVEWQYDFKSVYASILIDWFEVAEDKVASLLFEDYQYIPIVNKSCTTSTETVDHKVVINLELSPNPSNGLARIKAEVPNGVYRLDVFNTLGSKVGQVFENRQIVQNDEINIDLSYLPSGKYLLRLASTTVQKTIKMSVIN